MKLCRACNTEKPEAEFYRDATRPDGLNWRCKPCHKVHVAYLAMQPPRKLAPEGLKRCQCCKENLPLDQFHGEKSQYDGKRRACKQCSLKRYQAWCAKHLGYLAAKQRERYRNNLDRYADYERRAHYGLAPGQYAAMLAEQDGRCAICGTDTPAPRKNFSVDHCHDTNQVRGLLCNKCNTGIGSLKHSMEILEGAIKYLQKYNSGERP